MEEQVDSELGITERALNALGMAESRLRDLVAEAARAGNRDDARQIDAWANKLARLPLLAMGSKRSIPETSRSQDNDHTQAESERSSSPRQDGNYPQFFRIREDLIKVGWSRKRKREYAHRIPRHNVDLVAQALARFTAGGNLASTNDFLPVFSPMDVADVPETQTYTCIGWLKGEGLIEQHGRRGYTVPHPTLLLSHIADRWQELPEVDAALASRLWKVRHTR